MPFHAHKRYALQMKLRPNPIMLLHQFLARRDVLHIDVFAYVRETKPDQVLFVYEFRRGGRGEPIERRLYKADMYGDDPPKLVDLRSWAPYDLTDAIKFNTNDLTWYPWAMRYHHTYMRKLAFLPLPPEFKHRSVLFHYFKAYDYDVFKRFHNFHSSRFGGKLTRSERRKGIGRVADMNEHTNK